MSTLTFYSILTNMVAILEKTRMKVMDIMRLLNFPNAISDSVMHDCHPTITRLALDSYGANRKGKDRVNGDEDVGLVNDCLPTATIFKELGSDGSKRKQRKDTTVTQEETQQDDNVHTPFNDPPLSEKARDAQAKEIANLKKRVQNLERKKKSRTTRLKRLKKVGRSIDDIDKDADVSLVDDTQGRSDNEEMFDINDLHGDEVNVDMPVGEKQEQSAKEREYMCHSELEVTRSQTSMIKDKGKAIMIEPEVPLKRKDQVALDEDLARNLQAQLEAELIEEERLARKKKKKPT
ncbi:hypothetical protein Tco_0331099 [Tanacetum coccineum]